MVFSPFDDEDTGKVCSLRDAISGVSKNPIGWNIERFYLREVFKHFKVLPFLLSKENSTHFLKACFLNVSL